MATPDVEADLRFEVFTRLWGVALLAHVVGNWALAHIPEAAGFANAAVGTLGMALALRPRRVLLLVASVAVVGSVLLETPRLGNHWLLAGLVSLAVLAVRGDPVRLFPTARWILLIFYSFAAFAKINSGFLDSEVSCAVFYANQWLDGLGIEEVAASSALARGIIAGTVGVELAVPLLLVMRRTRSLGVLVASAFHILISYDLNQHFYDFTAVLLALFFLFQPGDSVEGFTPKLRGPALRYVKGAFVGVGMVMLMAAVTPPRPVTIPLVTKLPFLLWVPFSIWWLWATAKALQLNGRQGERLVWRLSPLAFLIVVVTFLNGITPYTEVKTAFGFNMYANLLTADGESNHLVIRRTWPLRRGYSDPVEIIGSSDPALERYRELELLIAFPEFRRYAAAHPEVGATFDRGGVRFELERLGDDPSLVMSGPWWERFLPLRSIDKHRPPRCQDVFLPAL